MARLENPRAGVPRYRYTPDDELITVIGGPEIDITQIDPEELYWNAIRKEERAINQEADTLLLELESINNLADYLTEEEIIERYAVMRTVQQLSTVAFKTLKAKVVAAMVETVEYNHPLYVSHMLTALEMNQDRIISVNVETWRGEPQFNITLEMWVLGDPLEWYDAMRPFKLDDAQLRSHMWEEKYYGVDREGNTITKTYTTKQGTEERDITSRYAGKYAETIQERLENVGSHLAPFWYFIEHGTQEGQNQGGTPYPRFQGTNFVYDTELRLQTSARNLYREYRDTVDKFLTNKYAKMIGLERIGPKLRQLLETQGEHISQRIAEIMEQHDTGLIDPSYQKSLYSFADEVRGKWHFFQRGGTLYLSKYDENRWVSTIGINE